MKFRTKINLALGLGLSLVVLFGLGAYGTIRDFLGDARTESQSHDAVLMLERIVSRLKATESAQRKFLITGQPRDLQSYQRNHAGTVHAAAAARRSPAFADDRGLLDALEAVLRQRLDRMELVVRASESGGHDAVVALVGSDVSRTLDEEIDRLVRAVKVSESASLEAAQTQTERKARIMVWLVGGGGLVSVALLGWAIVLVQRHEARQRQAETRLSRNEARTRQIMNAVPAMIAYADAFRRVQFHNQACEEGLALTAERVHGRHLNDVFADADGASPEVHIEQAYAGYAASFQAVFCNAQGARREYEMNYFPRYGEGEDEGRVVGIYALGTDITEFKRIDRLKSEFVATVSHELRTPLTSIHGSLGLLGGGVAGPLPEMARTLVEVASVNSERLIRLLNEILDSHKIESGAMRLELRATALQPLLAQAVASNTGFAAQHQVTLELDAPEPELRARVDPDRFTQVVTNLLSNAAKFSPPGARVQLVLLRGSEGARIEVRDRGAGIPADFHQRIFQRFSQADASDARRKGGTGLGLSISRDLVERMGGRLDFRAEPDGGTTFFFELPLVEALQAEALP